MAIDSLGMREIERKKKLSISKTIYQYFFGLFLSILTSFIILKLWNFKLLNFPFQYGEDFIFYALTIKSTIINGWYLTNPSLGAPDGLILADFPMAEGFHYLLIKFLALFSSNWVLVSNVFFLLSFPLCTLSSLFVLKRLGLCYPFALCGSLLFSLLPYHFIRGVDHLFLSSYFIIPLVVWLAILIYQDKVFVTSGGASLPLRKKTHFLLLYSFICLLIGSTGIYYAFFGCFFLLITGLITSYMKGKLFPLRHAFLFVFLITSSMLLNILPSIIYKIKNGPNVIVADRMALETEVYGLKIAQLLLPIDQDRLKPLARIKKMYNFSPLVNENSSATLGVIGSIGFLILICRIFMQKKGKSNELLDVLSYLNLSAILLATIGGFSSLISHLTTSKIRAYNRISVYIAFFALTAFFLILHEWLLKKNKLEMKKTVLILSFLLLIVGIYNQTSPAFALPKKIKKISKAYNEDKHFFTKIEEILPKQSMVFQLPYVPFPECKLEKMSTYEHLKGYLHSDSLKWSYGAIKGRSTDCWQREVSSLSVEKMVDQLFHMGFKGICVNRMGYKDKGAAIEKQLSQILNISPLESGKLTFWDLRVKKGGSG